MNVKAITQDEYYCSMYFKTNRSIAKELIDAYHHILTKSLEAMIKNVRRELREKQKHD
jgi:hypothetical protein